MSEKDNSDEFLNQMKQTLAVLKEYAKEKKYDGRAGKEYLDRFFQAHDNNRDLFCRFVGFLSIEIEKPNVSKLVATRILFDVLMVGINIGWNSGYSDAKHIYSIL